MPGGARLALGAEALSAAPKWAIDVWTPDPESTASFDVQLLAKNRGCMLRRTLDLASANQKAVVSVRSAATKGEWADAGTFFTAGS